MKVWSVMINGSGHPLRRSNDRLCALDKIIKKLDRSGLARLFQTALNILGFHNRKFIYL